MCDTAPDAPPAPDYAKAAQVTAQGNANAARIAQYGNMTNQVTPQGTVTYNPKTTGYMDEKGNRVTTEHFETNENGFIEKHSGYDVILCSVCGEATIIGMNSDSETCGSFKCDNKKPSNNC